MVDESPLSGNLFVATGENGLRAFSTDGATWMHQATDREGVLLSQVAFANGGCVAAGRYGGQCLAFSTSDAVRWERVELPIRPYATRLEALFTLGEQFQGVLHEDGESPGLITSPDGIKWSERERMLDDPKMIRHDAHLRRVVAGNDRLVSIGDYGARLVRANDSAKWTAVPDAKATDTLIDITYGNGVFVGGGLHGLRMKSADGLTWTDRIVGEEGEHLNAMIFDGQRFVGVGQGATYSSRDGTEWQRTPNENAPTQTLFASGLYLGVVWPGRLLSSTDAITWRDVHEFPHHVLGLAFGRLGTIQ